MASSFVALIDGDSYINPNAPVLPSIYEQFEAIVIRSLITSFGLDFIVRDQHGGDVDTIHNVRKIGQDATSDPQMDYKSDANYQKYLDNGHYNSLEYHSGAYNQTRAQFEDQRQAGNLTDTYTGETLRVNDRFNLDHVIPASEIHRDRGRVLSGLSGVELANSPENLRPTNESLNKSKNNSSMSDFLARPGQGDKFSDVQKQRMMKHDTRSRRSYEHKLFVAYYTSSEFIKDSAIASGNVAGRMGAREALGLLFTEIWLSVSSGIRNLGDGFTAKELFMEIAENVKAGVKAAQKKYKEIFARFLDGALAGAISSITTTLCNIFFTTAKNIVRVIRQSWASIVEAIKILLFNPEGYLIGDRIKAAVKVLAMGASVLAGTLVAEMISTSPLGVIPVCGEIVQTFCGTLTTGILSCSLLYMLDRSDLINKIVAFLNTLPSIDKVVDFYRTQAARFEEYAASLMSIDIVTFKKETEMYASIAYSLDNSSVNGLHESLSEIYDKYGIARPYEGSFSDFMKDRSRKLVFK